MLKKSSPIRLLLQEQSDIELLTAPKDWWDRWSHHCHTVENSTTGCYRSSVGSQNLVTLIFTKTSVCQGGNTKRMVHILSNSCSSRPIRTPLQSVNHASKYRIYEKFHYFGAHFTEIRGFAMKKMLKMS